MFYVYNRLKTPSVVFVALLLCQLKSLLFLLSVGSAEILALYSAVWVADVHWACVSIDLMKRVCIPIDGLICKMQPTATLVLAAGTTARN